MKTKISKNKTKFKYILSIMLAFLAIGFSSNLTFVNHDNDENTLIYSNSSLKTSQSVHWGSSEAVICTEDGDQRDFVSIYDDLGSNFVLWTDERNESEVGLYVQKINSATGQVQWKENGIFIVSLAGIDWWYWGFELVSDGFGGVIIAWEDHRQGGAYYYGNIYAQRVNSTGYIQWTHSGIPVCSENSFQYNPQLVSDGSGGAIIVWQDYRSGESDIYAQKINSTGYSLWTNNGTAICSEIGNQVGFQVISDNDRGAILAWQDNRSGEFDIYAQRINSSGYSLWTNNGSIICSEIGNQGILQIISDNNEGAILAWIDDRNGEQDVNIYAQRINSNGQLQWDEDGVPVCTAPNYQGSLNIIKDGQGGAIFAWKDERDGNYYDIYAQKLNLTGHEQWTHDGVKICNPRSHASFHKSQEDTVILIYSCDLVSDGTGGAIIAWLEWNGGSTGRIYTQRIDDEGNTKWTPNGVAVLTATGMDRMTLNSNGLGGAVVFMNKYEYPYDDNIYARCIPHEGIADSSNFELILIVTISIVVISIIAISIFVVLKKRSAGKLFGNARDKILEMYRKKLGRDPLNTDLRLKLGQHYQNNGEYEQAILNFKTVLELDPDNKEAQASLNSIKDHNSY